MRKEDEVILLGCMIKRNDSEEKRLLELLDSELDWSRIAGELIHHRLLGYFYIGVQNLDRYVMAEFYRSVKLLSKAQKIITKQRYELLQPLIKKFEENGIRYACLKGLVFGLTIYPYEARRSNDCDLLVLEKDLDLTDSVLVSEGFMQSADKGVSPATKKQKLIQRLNYHDLVPYYKKIDSELIDYIKIDINFHLDSKDNDITEEFLEYGTEIIKKDGFIIRSLVPATHFLQLCVHFYREASNSLWTSQKRDLLLYKVVDIYNTYVNMSGESVLECIHLSEKFNISKSLYFTFYYLMKFYPNSDVYKYMNKVKQYEINEISKIYITGEDKYIDREQELVDSAFDLVYHNDFSKRNGK